MAGTAAETWKKIPIEGCLYSASNTGKIRRDARGPHTRPGLIVRGCITKGYRRVLLYNGGVRKAYSVHRLVALAFIGECPTDHVVNHKNGVTTDNGVDNLEYVTQSGNRLHAANVLGRFTGDRNGARVRPERLARGDRNGSRIHPESRPRGESAKMAKTNEIDVRNIRSLYADGKFTIVQLGKMFGIGKSAVSYIIRRQTWAHVN